WASPPIGWGASCGACPRWSGGCGAARARCLSWWGSTLPWPIRWGCGRTDSTDRTDLINPTYSNPSYRLLRGHVVGPEKLAATDVQSTIGYHGVRPVLGFALGDLELTRALEAFGGCLDQAHN